MTKSYIEKLRDPRWQKKRLEILSRDDWQCQECESRTKNLQVHHRYYKAKTEPWDYPDEALRTLCEDCHKAEGIFDEAFSELKALIRDTGAPMAEIKRLTTKYKVLVFRKQLVRRISRLSDADSIIEALCAANVTIDEEYIKIQWTRHEDVAYKERLTPKTTRTILEEATEALIGKRLTVLLGLTVITKDKSLTQSRPIDFPPSVLSQMANDKRLTRYKPKAETVTTYGAYEDPI